MRFRLDAEEPASFSVTCILISNLIWFALPNRWEEVCPYQQFSAARAFPMCSVTETMVRPSGAILSPVQQAWR